MSSAMNFILVVFAVGLVIASYEVRDKRQALLRYNKWTNNTMNYFYAKNMPLEMEAMFRDAFDYLSKHSCLKFNYDKYAKSSVKIALENGCWSYYGMRAEQQILKFAPHCASFGVAVHELMHALGFAHGQCRSDRDQYIVVDSNDHNNEKLDTDNPVPFDYGSVMMYSRDDHIWPLDPEYNYTMGSYRVAFYDMILLNDYYKCNCDDHPTKLECKNGGYQNPFNCDKCLCTDGFRGKLCDELLGEVLKASREWNVIQSIPFDNKTEIANNTMPETRYFVITAPEKSIIEVKITKLDGFRCGNACDYNGVELKYKTDRRIVSPLVCCDNDNLWNTTRSSTNNPFVIVQYGNNRTPIFGFEYRYVPGNSTVSELTNEISSD